MTHEELKMKFESTAEWRRRKLEESPDDQRNAKAADLLERLAKTVSDVPQHLLDAYKATFFRVDDMSSVIDLESSLLRAVGFRITPENATDFIEEFLEMASGVPGAESYRPKVVD